MSCTSATGAGVLFGDATEVSFTLADGDTWSGPEEANAFEVTSLEVTKMIEGETAPEASRLRTG